ncbi:MAG: ATP-binding cassette domain-containing protein [Actinobacteria bacterium]|nr:ATP-binding cassette domain-containing protein [Actinomycetota bacterium]MCL6104519.1 ATP-binding cassette domain-containing protein [Actinomycetota bacterium]
MEPLRFDQVGITRSAHKLINNLSWKVASGQRWVILGPNGSGKTTILMLASARLFPSSGTVEILGCKLGKTDTRYLKSRIGLSAPLESRMFSATGTAIEMVMTGKYGDLAPWWHHYDSQDKRHALLLLGQAELEEKAEEAFGVLSEGERQKVLIARALMPRQAGFATREVELLLLDEPSAGLDLGGREHLLAYLENIMKNPQLSAVVMVTHHTEQIPLGISHAALLKKGEFMAQGPIEEVLSDSNISECFDIQLKIRYEKGRWWTARL